MHIGVGLKELTTEEENKNKKRMCASGEDFNKIIYIIFIVPCGKFGSPYATREEPRMCLGCEKSFLFLSLKKILIVPCGKFGWPYPVRHSSSKSSATHSCQCVRYFRVSKQ